MPLYRYKAVDPGGREYQGQLVVDSEWVLGERLRQQGLILVRAELAEIALPRHRWRRIRLRGSTLRSQLIQFCTLMSFMLEGGIPLVEALGYVATDCENRSFQKVLVSLKDLVEHGYQLSEAMEQFPGVFSPMMVSLVRSGEVSGQLPDILQHLRQYFEWLEQVASDVKQTSIYPAAILILIVGLIVFLFTIVIPQFERLLREAGVPLPPITRFMFSIGATAQRFWWLILGTLIGIPVALSVLWRHSPQSALALDRIRFKLPVFGPLFHMLACSRFAHNLGLLYKAGVNLLVALKYTAKTVGSPLVSRSIEGVISKVEAGLTLSEAMAEESTFPSLLTRVVAVGERSGHLDEALGNVSTYYDTVIPRRVKKILGIIEPILTMILVAIVGFVALAIFTPLLSLMRAVR